MSRVWMLPLLLAAGMALAGCKNGKKTETEAPPADTTVTKKDTVAVDSAQVAEDKFVKVSRTAYWQTKEKNEDYGDYLYSCIKVDIQWPEQLAGCKSTDALHRELLKVMFGKGTSKRLEAAVDAYLSKPGFIYEDEPVAVKKITKKEVGNGMTTWENYVGLETHMTSPTLTAFSVHTYDYAGGAAHGMYSTNYVVFDRKSGTVFTEAKVFKNPNGQKLLRIINKYIAKKKRAGGGSYDKAATLTTFYPDKEGLTFAFQPYAIASYAEGIIEVTVPYAALAEELTPDFKELVKGAESFQVNKKKKGLEFSF